MKRLARILLLLLTTALLAAACRKTQDDEPQLIIWLDIETPTGTKASEGEVPAEGSEDAIKDLRVWVFLHDDFDESRPSGYLLGYFKPSADDPLTSFENRYHIIPLSRDIAAAKPKVDIYVIGNPSSVGQSGLGKGTSRETLDNLTMTGTLFGVEDDEPKQKTVPDTGLPYTGVAKGLSMTGSYPVMRVDAVTVRKAVSKFRFVFCQLRDEAGPMINNLQITGLSLNGPNICDEEYLFNDSAYPYKVNGYREDAITFNVPTSIRRYAAPEEFVFNPPADPVLREEYARQYEALINDGISSKKALTEAGRCYLRETDKQLSGKVTYTYVDGNETRHQQATFTMHAPGDFARGRSWIVYVYFLREAMHFSVNWSDWAEGNEWSLTPIDPMHS